MGTLYNQILVPVSGQAVDDEAVELACSLANGRKSRVSVLYVIAVARTLPLDAEIPRETARGEEVLQHLERIGRRHKCKIEGLIVQARDVGPAVVQEAAECRGDLIVVGMPAERRYGAPSLGESVPYILKYAPCQVVVTRERRADGAKAV